MNNYFTISELCISDEDIPQHVADKLLKHHILQMNVVREKLGAPIWASQNSGYRPYTWEIARGRSGRSQHTFGDKGAVDWTCSDLKELFKLLLEHTSYTRIAVYPSDEGNFIHCDHKASSRQLFLSDSGSDWKLSTEAQILEKL